MRQMLLPSLAGEEPGGSEGSLPNVTYPACAKLLDPTPEDKAGALFQVAAGNNRSKPGPSNRHVSSVLQGFHVYSLIAFCLFSNSAGRRQLYSFSLVREMGCREVK